MPNIILAVQRIRIPPVESVSDLGAGNFGGALTNFGNIKSWGVNYTGQLGDNTTTLPSNPVNLGGATKTFCKISVGNNANYTEGRQMAITNTGRLWAWGSGTNFALGDGNSSSRRTPVSVIGAVKTFCQICTADQGNYSLAIDKNGRIWSWGTNSVGELGDNSLILKSTPVSVLGAVKTFCKIAASGNVSGAIDKNGRIWSWGINQFGELGDNTVVSKLTPVALSGATKTFCSLSKGWNHTVALDLRGRAWSWGLNANGQLGDNTSTSRRTPISVLGAIKTFCKISSGQNYNLALTNRGRAWAWGSNVTGVFGNGQDSQCRFTPVSVAGAVKTFCDIFAGNGTVSFAIDKNGDIWGWGYNFTGELGIPPTITPRQISGSTKVFNFIDSNLTNDATTAAIDEFGRAWGWGVNTIGTVGDNSTLSRLTPVSVGGTSRTFCAISSRWQHVMALNQNGLAWGWGANNVGQLGDNSITQRLIPVSVAGAVKTFCKISAGSSFTTAIRRDGRVFAWGANTNGELGDNTIVSKRTPVSISGNTKTFCEISSGVNFTNAIDKNGRIWSWGVNTYGQLGDNSVTSRRTPVSILGAVKTFCTVSSGSHVLAIQTNGRLWGWGYNLYGQLGDNSVTSRRTPVSIQGAVKTFCKITSGFEHSCAIDKNGRAWCWGYNLYGQLGNNDLTVTSSRTPRSVMGSIKTFCDIKAGYDFTSAIDRYGRVWQWGRYLNGRLGINLQTKTPILIPTL